MADVVFRPGRMVGAPGGIPEGFRPSTESSFPGLTAQEVSDAFTNDSGTETIVKQAPAQEQDINEIVRRYAGTGFLPVGPGAPVYGDFSGVLDYDSAVEKVEEVERRFMSLPPEVRLRFNNSPSELVRQVSVMTTDELAKALEVPAGGGPAGSESAPTNSGG